MLSFVVITDACFSLHLHAVILVTIVRWSIGKQLLTPPEELRRMERQSLLSSGESIDGVEQQVDQSPAGTGVHQVDSQASSSSLSSTLFRQRSSSLSSMEHESTSMDDLNDPSFRPLALEHFPVNNPRYFSLARQKSRRSASARAFLDKSRSVFQKAWSAIKQFMNPPLAASIIALVVGLTPMKQWFFGDDAPLKGTVTATIDTIGQAAVPMIMLCLGAAVARGPPASPLARPRATIATCLVRFIVMPLVAVGWVELLALMYEPLRANTMLRVVLLMSACGPTAVNLSNVSIMNEFLVDEITYLLFYSYLTFVPFELAAVIGFLALSTRPQSS
jgi:predicted permease